MHRLQKRHTAEQYEGHLRNEHGMKDCPFCKESPLDVARLREHILQWYGPEWACPQCSELQKADSLSSHLQRLHSWVICGFCSRASLDSPKMENHKQLEHDPKACSVCHSVMPAALLPSHLVQNHHYVVCPPHASSVDDCGVKSPSGHGPMRGDLEVPLCIPSHAVQALFLAASPDLHNSLHPATSTRTLKRGPPQTLSRRQHGQERIPGSRPLTSNGASTHSSAFRR